MYNKKYCNTECCNSIRRAVEYILLTVVDTHTAASTVKLELPPELTAQWVHLTFHVSLIQAHVPNNDEWFPHCDMATCYDFGTTGEPEWFVNKILAHCWVDRAHLEFQVCWTLGDIKWEPLAKCKELEALDEYLELHGVQQPCNLPCKPDLPGRTCHVWTSVVAHFWPLAQRSTNSAIQLPKKFEQSSNCHSAQNHTNMATPMDQYDPTGSSVAQSNTPSMLDIIHAHKTASTWKLFMGSHFTTLCHNKGCHPCATYMLHLTWGAHTGELGPQPKGLKHVLEEAWPEATRHLHQDASQELAKAN